MAVLERSSATPAAIRSYFEWVLQQDIQDVLRAIQAPTRVLCVPDLAIPEAAVRHVAELIPKGTFHLMPPIPTGHVHRSDRASDDRPPRGGRHWDDTPDLVDRFLGTVLFTDVVSSTELLERVGDATYRQMRTDHERGAARGGELRWSSDDRDRRRDAQRVRQPHEEPSGAPRRSAVKPRSAGIAVRAGIHTGELEHDAMNVTGLTCTSAPGSARPLSRARSSCREPSMTWSPAPAYVREPRRARAEGVSGRGSCLP